jgi:hypothetical protein
MSGGPAQAALSERSGFRPPSPRFFFSSRLLFLLRSETRVSRRAYHDRHSIPTCALFRCSPLVFYFLHPFCSPSPRRVVVWETDRFDSTGHIIASEFEEDIFRILGTSDRGMICLRGLEDAHDPTRRRGRLLLGELQALAHFVFIRVILS